MAGTRFQVNWSSLLSTVQPYNVVDVTHPSQIKQNKTRRRQQNNKILKKPTKQHNKNKKQSRSSFVRHLKMQSFCKSQSDLQKSSVSSDVPCIKLEPLFRLSIFQTESLSKQEFQEHSLMLVLICMVIKMYI